MKIDMKNEFTTTKHSDVHMKEYENLNVQISIEGRLIRKQASRVL